MAGSQGGGIVRRKDRVIPPTLRVPNPEGREDDDLDDLPVAPATSEEEKEELPDQLIARAEEQVYRILQRLPSESHADRRRGTSGDRDLRKTFGEVFDRRTMMILYKLMNDGRIETLEYPISTGKEANVFVASTAQGLIAVKIFRIATATFRRMLPYLDGDPRFGRVRRNRQALKRIFALKEYKNLQRAAGAGVRVPQPLWVSGHMLGMELLGDDTSPAPQLSDLRPSAAEGARLWGLVLEDVRRLVVRGGIVHGDLSPFNVLLHRDAPYLIDFAQGVVVDHPQALSFLIRDLEGLVKACTRFGIPLEPGADARSWLEEAQAAGPRRSRPTEQG